MEWELLAFLYGPQRRTICLRGGEVTMRLLPAAELLALRAEEENEQDDFSAALRTGAALAAKCLSKDGAPLFDDARAVMQTLSAEEINGIMAAYEAWSRRVDPGFDSAAEDVQALKKDCSMRRKNGCGGAC